MSEIELRFNPQLGTWYNPLTWYGKESSPAPQVQTKPAVDDFFAPGEEKKMEQLIREKLIAEWRHNLMLAAAGAGFALVLILLFRKKK